MSAAHERSDTDQTLVSEVEKGVSTPDVELPLPVLDGHGTTIHPLATLSPLKKNVLLLVFAIATFLDICNISGVGLAVPNIAMDIGLGFNQLSWVRVPADRC